MYYFKAIKLAGMRKGSVRTRAHKGRKMPYQRYASGTDVAHMWYGRFLGKMRLVTGEPKWGGGVLEYWRWDGAW